MSAKLTLVLLSAAVFAGLLAAHSTENLPAISWTEPEAAEEAFPLPSGPLTGAISQDMKSVARDIQSLRPEPKTDRIAPAATETSFQLSQADMPEPPSPAPPAERSESASPEGNQAAEVDE